MKPSLFLTRGLSTPDGMASPKRARLGHTSGSYPIRSRGRGGEAVAVTRLFHRPVPETRKGFDGSEMPLAESLPGVAPDTKLQKFVSSMSGADGPREARQPLQDWSQDSIWASLLTPPHRPCRQEVRITSPLRQFIRLRVESYSSARGLPTGRVGKSVGYAAQRWRGDLLSTYISHLIPCCTLPHVHAWALSAVYAESLYLGDLIPPHRPCRQEVRNTSPLTACLNGPCTWWHSTKDG